MRRQLRPSSWATPLWFTKLALANLDTPVPVVDASTLPELPAVNPMLSVAAHARREDLAGVVSSCSSPAELTSSATSPVDDPLTGASGLADVAAEFEAIRHLLGNRAGNTRSGSEIGRGEPGR